MQTDSLSVLLSSLEVAESSAVGFELAAPWAIEFKVPLPLCWSIVEGSLWLREESGRVQQFLPGDTCIFPRGTTSKGYLLASDATCSGAVIGEEALFRRLFAGSKHSSAGATDAGLLGRRRVRLGAGEQVSAKAVSFVFNWQDRARALVQQLPNMMRLDACYSSKLARELVANLSFEEDDRAGAEVVTKAAAELFLIQSLRDYALHASTEQVGWLSAYAHPKISRVLTALHQEPGFAWSLEALSQTAGMSRTAFATTFKELMGQTPKEYVRTWRMFLAARSLLEESKTLITLAGELGYQSEAAFRTAFKNATGLSPQAYRKAHKRRSL